MYLPFLLPFLQNFCSSLLSLIRIFKVTQIIPKNVQQEEWPAFTSLSLSASASFIPVCLALFIFHNLTYLQQSSSWSLSPQFFIIYLFTRFSSWIPVLNDHPTPWFKLLMFLLFSTILSTWSLPGCESMKSQSYITHATPILYTRSWYCCCEWIKNNRI